jgi:amino acid permease
MISKFLKALFVFIGTIIGVGIFGLPRVASESGIILTLFYFILLSILAIIIHLIFAEVCLLTKTKHRFPGYVFKYLGRKWGNLALFSNLFGLYGAQLAYLIIGGSFLNKLLSVYLGGREIYYVLTFFIIGSILIFKGIKSIALSEILINVFFFSILAFLFIEATNYIKLENLLSPFRFSFYPYGVILFSLWGSAVVPEIKEIVEGKKNPLRRVIIGGIITSAIVYLLFIVLILGVCGKATSEDALSGLSLVFGENVVRIGYLFGVITCFTSYLTLGLTIKKIFWYDLKIPKSSSFFLAISIPLVLYLIGFKSFILVISLCGAIAIGIEGFIDVFLYKKALKTQLKQKMHSVFYFLPLFLGIGVIMEILFILQQ